MAFRRDHSRFSRLFQGGDEARIRVLAFIGNDGVGRDGRQQALRPVQTASLPPRQMQAGWIAQGIDCRMNLGTQATFATADGFIRIFFLRAPALC